MCSNNYTSPGFPKTYLIRKQHQGRAPELVTSVMAATTREACKKFAEWALDWLDNSEVNVEEQAYTEILSSYQKGDYPDRFSIALTTYYLEID